MYFNSKKDKLIDLRYNNDVSQSNYPYHNCKYDSYLFTSPFTEDNKYRNRVEPQSDSKEENI